MGLKILLKVNPGKMVMLPGSPCGPLYDGPVVPVRGPKLVPKSHISVSVGHMLNILVGKPVLRREKPRRAIIIPLDGALDLGPGGHRKTIRKEPVGEGLSKLKASVRCLEVPLVWRKLRGRVVQ